jgi:hypothetical protein
MKGDEGCGVSDCVIYVLKGLPLQHDNYLRLSGFLSLHCQLLCKGC